MPGRDEPLAEKLPAAAGPGGEALSLQLVCESVTHELRQPLTLIVGYAELLETRPFGETERAAMIGEIRRAAERLARSLERLEQLGRSEQVGLIRFGSDKPRRVLDLRG